MSCSICEHPKREQIETILLGSPNEDTIKDISLEYGLSETELKIHAMMHSTLKDNKQSIVHNAKCREADVLWEAAGEYMHTLAITGRKIAEAADSSEDIISFGRSLSKPLVDLYLGTGGELRACIRSISELDSILNGPQDATASGLAALAAAITRSKEQ